MTYISSALTYERDKVIVWEREPNGGRRIQKRYDAPYYFYVKDDAGTDKDIYGNSITKIDFDNYDDFNNAVKRRKEDGELLYESDIQADYKILSEKYFGKIPGKLNTTFFDIEVDYDPARGFSSPENPYAPISAVAIYHQHTNEMLVYAVPPDKSWFQKTIPNELTSLAKIVLCKNEKELLGYLLDEFEDSDILSGWNSEGYDIPYVYERLKKVLGQHAANRLSFKDARVPKYKEVKQKHGKVLQKLEIFGRVHIDYMILTQKFEPGERDSSALENVAEEVLPHLKKLTYEGSLAQLYHNDFLYFLRYNIRDCEILQGFEEKKGFMALAVILSHMDAGQIEDVIGTIKLTELSMINHCHHVLNQRVHDTKKDFDIVEGKYGGAIVLKPQAGLHEKVGSIDARSLYPSTMRTINISPETIIGQFLNDDADYTFLRKGAAYKDLTVRFEDGSVETRSNAEWIEFFREVGYAVSGFGTIFDQNRQGILPALLTSWFNQRKEYQKKAAEAEREYLRLKAAGLDYKEVRDQYQYFDKVQNIFKLKLNSTYGACGSRFFKFYDIRLAESTTKTGREILYHMARMIGLLTEGTYQYPNDAVIYGDTDSNYFKTYGTDIEDAFNIAIYITRKINESFAQFCADSFFTSEANSKLIEVSQEVVADRAIFTAGKKGYMMRVLKKDGNNVDKIKVTGLPIKKTSTPKPIRVKLTAYMEGFLKGTEWSDVGLKMLELKEAIIESRDVSLIGLPGNVNNVEDYVSRFNAKEPGLCLPFRVKASMFWNKCLEQYGDTESYQIVSGMKIRVLYLKKEIDGYDAIAIPVDLAIVPPWFKEHFLTNLDMQKQVLRLVDMPMKSLLLAIDQSIPSRKSLLTDELFS
jgi:DNA polymerase elongation subunit (family B)